MTLTRIPEDRRAAHVVWMAVAKQLGRPLSEVRVLCDELPVVLPLRLDDDDANNLLERLRTAGVVGNIEPAVGTALVCAAHHLDGTLLCNDCDATICTLCVALAGHQQRCEACERKERRKRRFVRVRVVLLSLVLAGVLVYAATDVLHRKRRNDWARPLVVAFVFLRLGEVDAKAVDALRARLPALEHRLNEELTRYRPTATPMRLLAFGPGEVSQVARQHQVVLGERHEAVPEPDLQPRYPQRYVEIMARMRPIAEGDEVLPDTLDELRVGPTTARDIGWLR